MEGLVFQYLNFRFWLLGFPLLREPSIVIIAVWSFDANDRTSKVAPGCHEQRPCATMLAATLHCLELRKIISGCGAGREDSPVDSDLSGGWGMEPY